MSRMAARGGPGRQATATDRAARSVQRAPRRRRAARAGPQHARRRQRPQPVFPAGPPGPRGQEPVSRDWRVAVAPRSWQQHAASGRSRPRARLQVRRRSDSDAAGRRRCVKSAPPWRSPWTARAEAGAPAALAALSPEPREDDVTGADEDPRGGKVPRGPPRRARAHRGEASSWSAPTARWSAGKTAVLSRAGGIRTRDLLTPRETRGVVHRISARSMMPLYCSLPGLKWSSC